jgi:outer membrane protein TolC
MPFFPHNAGTLKPRRFANPHGTMTLAARGVTAFMVLAAVAMARVDDLALTWEQSVQEAARSNADLATAQSNLEAARHQVGVARSGYLPQLSADAIYTESSGSATTIADPSYSASLNLAQNLFAGFADEARVEKERANVTSFEASLAAAKAKLSQDLKGAFAGLRLAQENVRLAETIVKRREENLKLVELRFEGGREDKGAYLLTRSQLAQARLELLQARQAIESSRQQLARVLGRNVVNELRVLGEVPVTEPPPAPDFAALARAAPDYIDALARETGAQSDVKLARSGYYPSVDLTGSVAREGADWFPGDDRRTVGLSLSIPLYSGGRDYYGVKAAAETLAATGSTRAAVERDVLVRLKQTYAAYVEAVERLMVDRDFREAAETRARIGRARYANGLMSFEDWDRIESDLIQREKNFLQSQRDRVTAEAAWEQVRGAGSIP